MKNAKLAVLAVLIIFTTSCAKREQKCKKWGYCGQNSTITEYMDTVRTDTIIQDDSQVCIDTLLETDNTYLKLKLNNNRVYVYMDIPADTVQVKGKDTVRIVKVNRVVEVNVLKQWQEILMWLGVVFLLLVSIFCILITSSYLNTKN